MPAVNPKYVWPIFFLIIFTGWAGFLIGRLTIPTPPKATTAPKNQNFFTDPTTSTRGKITKVTGNKITVVNSNGVRADIELLERISVNNLETGTNKLISSTDTANIPINKDVTISLALTNGVYKVNSITILLPAPPITTASPTTRPK